MNILYKFWDVLRGQQKTKPGRKEGIVIAGVYVKPKGLARTLQQGCVDRAVRNSHRPKFNSKFFHPRRFRQGMANLKP